MRSLVRQTAAASLFVLAAGCGLVADDEESVGTRQEALQTTPVRPVLRGVSLSGAEWATTPAYPTPAEVDYYLGIGMTTIRIPFSWERLQPTPLAAFAEAEFSKLDSIVRYAVDRGAMVVLDPHNFARYKGQILGSAAAPFSYFDDLWRRLAAQYKLSGRVVFGLMNEPNGISTEQWLTAANRAIAAIRGQSAANLVLVPGVAWTSVPSWFSNWYGTPNATGMLGVVDSLGNYAYEVHQYFDADGSGAGDCTNIDAGVQSLTPFVQWLRTNKRRAFVAEVGIRRTNACYATLARSLRLLEQSTDVALGWAYWAGGPNWGSSYALSMEPLGGVEAAQTQTMVPFLRPLDRRGVVLRGPEAGTAPGTFGADYVYPTTSELDHFLGRGMTTVVLPFLWERLQKAALGPLDATEMARVDAFVADVTSRGGQIILRLENRPAAFGKIVGSNLPDATFADLWSKLAARYAGNPRVGYGLASYAHDVTTERWVQAANAAIAAIRNAGSHQVVLVSGNGWSDAQHWAATWYGTSNAVGMKAITDAENNVVFDARLFVDDAGTGLGNTCVAEATVTSRMKPFVDWLRSEGRRGFIGAFGGPGTTATCRNALARGAAEIDGAHDVLTGWAWEHAGPRTGADPYTLEPAPLGTERTQWAALSPILKNLTAEVIVTSAWVGGLCAEVSVRNEGAPPATWHLVRLNFTGATLFDVWSGTMTATSSELRIAPATNGTLARGAFVKPGFCLSYGTTRPSLAVLSVE